MRIPAVCFCFLFATIQAAAQAEQPGPGGLAATGLVVGPSGEPQPGVPLRVEGPQGSTLAVTDEKGKWFLYNLTPGSYTVETLKDAIKQKDGDGGPVGSSGPLKFSVKPRPWFDRLGGRDAFIYQAPEIKLDQQR